MTENPIISALSFYPVKSCKAVGLQEAYAGQRGLRVGAITDRSWVIVDKDNVLVSQREVHKLARVVVELLYDKLGIAERIRVSADDCAPLILDPAKVGDERQTISIHGKETVGHKASEEISRWFSDYVGQPVGVFYQKEEDVRFCDPNFSAQPYIDTVGFADGYPYLVTTTGTLGDLNNNLENPVTMNRFRPNIVVGNVMGDSEYAWRSLAMGEAEFTFVKPCTRCVMTTLDQETGNRSGNQPLSTLAKTHFLSQKIGEARIQGAIFGENAVASRQGMIAVGDSITVLTTKPVHPFRRKDPSGLRPV